jgi:hypothetical protein
MSTIGKLERATHYRIIDLFCEHLSYIHVGNWSGLMTRFADVRLLTANLAEARQVKQGMMQGLLTGRTRLV